MAHCLALYALLTHSLHLALLLLLHELPVLVDVLYRDLDIGEQTLLSLEALVVDANEVFDKGDLARQVRDVSLRDYVYEQR